VSPRLEDLSGDELQALISCHAVRALDPADEQLAERLIASSPEWRAAYEQALETAAALALVPSAIQPPPALRDRILAAATAERQVAETPAPAPAPPDGDGRAAAVVSSLGGARDRRDRRERFALRLFAAAMAAAACVAIVFAFMATQDANELRDREAAAAQIASVLATPGTKVVGLQGPGGNGGAALMLPPDVQPMLVSTLPQAPASKTYQVWAVSNDGSTPRSIGVFDGGNPEDLVPLPPDAFQGAGTVAITVEPDGGSPAPTTAPFLLANL
jgi:hypothetical protein